MALSFKSIPQTNRIWVKDVISTPTWTTSISDTIRNEEISSKQDSINKLNNHFQNRSNIRRAISNGNISSWNKAQDVLEVRMWKLVDLYLNETSKATDDKWNPVFSTEKIIEASKNPSKVIEDMKKYYRYSSPDKVWAIDDYIQKWWMASNVFDYLEDVSWKINNPYGKFEAKWNVFDENTPSTVKWFSAISNYLPSLWLNLAGRALKNNWVLDKTFDLQTKIRDDASDEEYKLYKSGKLPEWNNVNKTNIFWESKANLYDEYSKAQEDWFIWSVDEYKDFAKKVNSTVANVAGDRIKEWILTQDDIDSSKASIATDALSELVTYFALPFSRAFKLKSADPLLKEIVNLTTDATINTAETVGIESLRNRNQTVWSAWANEWINLLINGITRSPVIAKYLKDINDSQVSDSMRDLLANVPDRIKDAYSRLSAEQLTNIKNMTKVDATKSSNKIANQWVKYFGKQWIDAMDTSLGAYLKAWEELGKEWQNLRNSGVTIDLIESSLNKELKNLENPTVMWDTYWAEWTAPQIHINKKKNGQWTLNIENRENLNMIENWKWEWLADAMEKIFNWMFKKQKWAAWAWMELNEATLLAFMNEVKWATQWTEWSWGNMWAKVFGEWLDAFRNQANLPESFLTKEKEFFNKKDLHNKLTDALGSYGKYTSDVDKQIKLFEAWKKLQDPNLQWVLELAQDAGYISNTLDAEMVAYWYMLALQDEAAARAFLWNVYPSEPWLIEAILETIRNWIREWTINKYIKAKSTQAKLSQWAWWMAWLSDSWREMYKTVWWWVNVAVNRLWEFEWMQWNDNKYSFTDEEYNEFLKNIMK